MPGTCIQPVYDLFQKEMDALLENYAAQTAQYAKKLTDESDKITLFNTLSFPRTDVAVLDEKGYAASLPSQRYTDLFGNEKLAVGGVAIDGFGSTVLELCDTPLHADSPFTYDGTTLETPFALIRFDDNGYIASFIDKQSGRELRKENGAPLGVLLFGEDVPLSYDNWDIDRDVVENLQPVCGFKGRTLVTDGAVEIRLRSTFEIENGTTLTQDLVCYADSPRVDFHTLVNWNSPHRLLKVGFDLDIAAKSAKSEIQFGAIERPTTANNSLELAKFEVCNRNYTDISEARFGAAVLNDCKYGICVLDCNVRLSLHRGGTHPDGTGDKGLHEMTYALLPHCGDFNAETVVQPAYMLNVPIVAAKGKADVKPLVTIGAPNVICEAVKPAEDDTNAFVLRLYECEGSKTKTSVRFSAPVAKAEFTNLLEDVQGEAQVCDGQLSLVFKPFEIKTVKVYR